MCVACCWGYPARICDSPWRAGVCPWISPVMLLLDVVLWPIFPGVALCMSQFCKFSYAHSARAVVQMQIDLPRMQSKDMHGRWDHAEDGD